MPTFMTFLLRLFLVAAGLLFVASLAVGAILMLAVWGVRAGWARLTGRPVTPFIVRMTPRGFGAFRWNAQPARPSRERPGAARRTELGDVTDVEAKQ